MDAPNLSEPWNRAIMDLLKKVAEESLGYRWMHNKEYNYYLSLDSRYNKIEIILLVFQTLLFGTNFVDFLSEWSFSNNIWVKLSIFLGQFIVLVCYGIVKAMREFHDISNRVLKHNMSAFRFGEIHTKIQEQFVLDVSRRESDKEFMQNVITVYNTLIYDALDIRDKTVDDYTKQIQNKDISKPVNLGGIDAVKIIVDQQNYQEVEPDLEPSLYNYEVNTWMAKTQNN